MEKIIVTGGTCLNGKVRISGAKNAVLPIIVATLLSPGKSKIVDVPHLSDVETLTEVLEILGAKVKRDGNVLDIDSSDVDCCEAPYEYVRKMRASILIIGPLLSRLGKVRISMPGGCAIGTRPIDLHLKGMEALGATINMDKGYIEARADKLKGSKIYLDFPSVGATENIMMAATLAEGVTVIENAAEEPEIVDLANFLNSMGASVMGAGTNVIRIKGVKYLRETTHTVIPDRIEAGTFLVAGAVTGGNILLENVITDHLNPVIAKLNECGVTIREENSGLRVIGQKLIKAVDIKTLPYPGFPTDMQAQFMVLLSKAIGTSLVSETVFENRFMHADELKRMGVDVRIEGRSAVIEGGKKITGCPVKATDLRAGAALILAGLIADGETEITNVHHIYRGYENIVDKFRTLGAKIRIEK